MFNWVLKLHNELQSGINFPTAGLGKTIPYKIETLPLRTCEFCKYDSLYEASLFCFKCKAGWEPCMITGYPLLKQQTVKCKKCQKGALRDAMRSYFNVTKRCPWCAPKQIININVDMQNGIIDANSKQWER